MGSGDNGQLDFVYRDHRVSFASNPNLDFSPMVFRRNAEALLADISTL